jgi:phage terminase large subunit-like protein
LTLGADASTTHDFTALVGMNGEQVRYVRVWKPKSVVGIRFGKPTVDLEATIGAEVLELFRRGCVECVVYDPWQMAAVARSWEKAGIKCIEMPQTAQRVEADTALFNAIISGQVKHYRSPDLDEAVRNAIVQETPRGIRLAKEKASRKIDPLVALSMANSTARQMANRTVNVSMRAKVSNYIRDGTLSLDDLQHPHGDIYSEPQYIQFIRRQ